MLSVSQSLERWRSWSQQSQGLVFGCVTLRREEEEVDLVTKALSLNDDEATKVVLVAMTKVWFPWCSRDPVAVAGVVGASCRSHGAFSSRKRRWSRIDECTFLPSFNV